ncbi:MAG: esterase [Candidatus Delongbacteria bacterium]|nr:esterase [Candidatus Delongbacteria bacterium]
MRKGSVVANSRQITVLALLWVLLGPQAGAQAATAVIHFELGTIPTDMPPEAELYLAGNFNNWDPADSKARFLSDHEGYHLTLSFPEYPVYLEFKVTRGNWDTVEKNADGSERDNRIYTLASSRDTLQIVVAGWSEQADDTAVSTASGNIVLLTGFEMPQLQRNGTIRIYLPANYHSCACRFPVMYMHDGQNLFDDSTAFAGEWGVDEILESPQQKGRLKGLIVVGIDNGAELRVSEYAPWDFNYDDETVHGRGDDYLNFIVQTLKPFIDQNYRTLPDRNHTALAGSSLGGLISLYGGLRHQEVFSRVAALSPSVTERFVGSNLEEFIAKQGRQYPLRVYLDMGDREGGAYDAVAAVQAVQRTVQLMQAAGFGADELRLEIIPGGRHNESSWQAQMEDILIWLWEDQVGPVQSE